MRKLFILGLDGATFDVIKPLVSEGRLPNLNRLMESGAYGVLRSTIPPITGPAWLAMATGLNAGKTGVIDFLYRAGAEYRLRPVTSADFKGKAIWDILHKAGFSSLVFQYPMLYPPYEIKGVMSSGIGTLEESSSFAPKEIYEQVKERAPKYTTTINYHNEKYNDISLYFKDAVDFLDNYKKALFWLLEREWNFAFAVLSLSDWTQHLMWSHWIDKQSPYNETFKKIWEMIDAFIGELLGRIGDSNIFIVSDHGFGTHKLTFNLTRWLVENKFMRLKKESRGQSKIKIEDIDFRKSVAFTLGHTFPFGGIYINAPFGTKKHRKIYQKITDKLKKLEKQETGRLKFDIFSSAELYAGPKQQFLPDIILSVNDWAGFVYENNMSQPVVSYQPHSSRLTGSHRVNGIFIAAGPDVLKSDTELKGISLFDVFPTALEFMGLAARATDGRVIPIIK